MFKKNHFIIGYQGNKRGECKEILDYIIDKKGLKDIQTIAEPYAGTSALSCYISKLYPKKYKYILNDTDEHLINLYNILKDEEQLRDFINEINNLVFLENGDFIKKEDYLKIENPFYKWFIHRKFYSLRPGLYPIQKKPVKLNIENILKLEIIRFLKNEDVELSHMDGVEFIKTRNNNDIIFILDPPYLLSHNSTYYELPLINKNIYEYFYLNKNKINFKFLFIVENSWIIKLLFEEFNNYSYKKKYSNFEKKTTTHAIYSNF
jgi:site-specific DNA-adenine methylase